LGERRPLYAASETSIEIAAELGILVRAVGGEIVDRVSSTVQRTDHVGGEDRGEAAGGGHCSGTPALRMPSKIRSCSAT